MILNYFESRCFSIVGSCIKSVQHVGGSQKDGTRKSAYLFDGIKKKLYIFWPILEIGVLVFYFERYIADILK